jgi:hypothetical protein
MISVILAVRPPGLFANGSASAVTACILGIDRFFRYVDCIRRGGALVKRKPAIGIAGLILLHQQHSKPQV